LAGSLAEKLQASGLAPRVIWRSPFREDPAELADLVAYLWFNQSPEAFEALSRRFRDDRLGPTLQATLDRMATSLSPREVARLGRDPFGLTNVGDGAARTLGNGEAELFASADGRFRVLFVPAPLHDPGFWAYRRWVSQIREVVETWRQGAGRGSGLSVKITGNPAFVAEVGSSLLRDVQLAALGTLMVVALLFWLTYRRWAALVWLVVLLVVALATTVALGAILLGTLHAVSLGFTAILLGLAADYGLILYQDYIVHPGRSLAEHRAAVAPGILWAAVTTAGAFLMLGRSSLPGLNQLGTLVAIGVLVAAGLMLAAFLPPLMARDRVRPTAAARTWSQNPDGVLVRLFASRRSVLPVTLLAAAGAGALLIHQAPAVEYGTEGLGPKAARARAALQEVRTEVGGLEGGLWVMVKGRDEAEVAGRMRRVAAVLDKATEQGLVKGYRLPQALWPQPDHQRANRDRARRLAVRLPQVRDAAIRAGFTPESLRLTEQVFGAWERFAASDVPVRPDSPGARWMLRKFVSGDSGRLLVLGRAQPSPSADRAGLRRLAEEIDRIDGAQLFGWSLLTDSLVGVMERDVRQVLLPMGVVLVVLLALAFRNIGETVLSLSTLGLTLLCLLGSMRLLDWSWNLMNMMALPLVLGAGVDYSIHIQHALRRYGGDIARTRQAIGPAILLCAATTTTAFGSLGFASNAGLASLGRVSAVGVALAGLISVFLLPVWWKTIQFRKHRQPALEPR
jgi:predicted exporter